MEDSSPTFSKTRLLGLIGHASYTLEWWLRRESDEETKEGIQWSYVDAVF